MRDKDSVKISGKHVFDGMMLCRQGGLSVKIAGLIIFDGKSREEKRLLRIKCPEMSVKKPVSRVFDGTGRLRN